MSLLLALVLLADPTVERAPDPWTFEELIARHEAELDELRAENAMLKRFCQRYEAQNESARDEAIRLILRIQALRRQLAEAERRAAAK